jgi:hypothetical protein
MTFTEWLLTQGPFVLALGIALWTAYKDVWRFTGTVNHLIVQYELRLKSSNDACQEWKDIALKSLDAAKTTALSAEKIATVKAVARKTTE